MEQFSSMEILNFALENGIINSNSIHTQMQLSERQKYLEEHQYAIYQGKDGLWYTYLPGEEGRDKIKRKSKEAVEDVVHEFYKKRHQEPTIQRVFDEWIEQKLEYKEIRKQTYDRYQTDFHRFFVKNEFFKDFANRKIKYLSEEELEDFIKKTIAKMDLTQKAFSGMRLLINGIFKYAKKKKYTSISVTQFMGDIEVSRRAFKPNVKNKEDEVYQEAEAERLTQYLAQQEDDIRALGLLLIFHCGLRIGELCALKPEDCSEKHLHIQRTEVKVKVDEHYTMLIQDYPKSDAGERYVILTESARKTLECILKARESGEFLFTDNGKRIRSNGFRRKLMRVCKQLNIKYRSNHKIRKTYGTALIDGKVDDSIIAEQMGHTDVATTKKFYYYSNKSEEKKISQVSAAVPW